MTVNGQALSHSPSSGRSEPLTTDETAAWHGLLRASTKLLNTLDRDLEVGFGLSLGDYHVLVALADGPPDGVRMSVLAERALLSKSRLSHCVDRLSAAGYVVRERVLDDRRGLLAVLTDQGRVLLDKCAPVHNEGVRRHFLDLLDPCDLRTLGGFCDRLNAGWE